MTVTQDEIHHHIKAIDEALAEMRTAHAALKRAGQIMHGMDTDVSEKLENEGRWEWTVPDSEIPELAGVDLAIDTLMHKWMDMVAEAQRQLTPRAIYPNPEDD